MPSLKREFEITLCVNGDALSLFPRHATLCDKREPGSGCPARDGQNRMSAILGVSPHCIAAYPGDLADDRRFNPLEVKGLAELALCGVAPAIVNAVCHATGIRVRSLPITPEKLIAPEDRASGLHRFGE